MNQSPGPVDPGQAVSLPADRSFVLQFRPGSGVEPGGPCSGRVEHIVSGEATRFDDCTALCEFIMRMLRMRGGPPAAAHEEGSA